MFGNATGASTAPNLAICNARFREGRHVQGVIAAKTSKTKTIGYVASFPAPEAIHAIDTAMRGAWSIDPEMKLRIVRVNAWFNPGMEADAARALIDQGCDALRQHADSPAPLHLAEGRGVFGFGQAIDMTRFAPNAHLTSSIDDRGDCCAARARAMLDGTRAPADTWGGPASGMSSLAPFADMDAETAAHAEAVVAALKDGSLRPFQGPIVNQAGETVVPAGERLSDDAIRAMNHFHRRIDAAMPR